MCNSHFPIRVSFATQIFEPGPARNGNVTLAYYLPNAGMLDAKVKIILVNILRERTRLGLTQEYMGYKMGISQNAYSKIELGYTALTVNALLKIADIFGCPVEKLLETQ